MFFRRGVARSKEARMRLRRITASTVVLALTAAAVLALAGSVAAVESALPAGNLVKNPGGESPLGGDINTKNIAPAGWQDMPHPDPTRGPGPGVQVVRYGTHQFVLLPALSASIGGGRNFFAGRYPNNESGAFQMIDVSRAAADIDAGGVKACLSAYLGGGLEGAAVTDGSARADLRFLGEGDAPRGQLSIGPVMKGHRKGAATLLWRASERAVPAGTRTLRVSLDLRGFFSSGTFADNVSVALTKGRCIPQLAVRCQRGALLATVTPSDAVRTQRVRFQVRGAKGQKLVNDARAPYAARVPTSGLTGSLTVTATLTQVGGGNVVLTKKSRRC
jgi:hypothetical protein